MTEKPVEHRLAVAIPTYNSSVYMKEFLDQSLELFEQNHIDIYIYDSSPDDKTEKLLEGLMEKRAGLWYVRVPQEVHSNKKVYQIFQDFRFREEYDFLWVCGDALRYSQTALDKVFNHLNQELSMLVVDIENGVRGGERTYTEPGDFFRECAGYLTLYGAVVLNIKKMIATADWNSYNSKYLGPDTINFSHLCFYFDHISRTQDFKAACIKLQRNEGYSSPLKKYSLWKEETFKIWCHCWPSAVNSLPSYYPDRDKAAVIREKGIYSSILSKENLEYLRARHIYNVCIFLHYRKAWRNLTDMPIFQLFCLAIVPADLLGGWKNFERNRQIRSIKNFCKQHRRIFIYGTGIVASRCVEYLEECGIGYEAFVVSGARPQDVRFLNHSILGIDEYLVSVRADNDGIILAMNESNIVNVAASLREKGVSGDLYTQYIKPLRK